MAPLPKIRERIFFLDNLRYLMILGVVGVHSALGYNSFPIWSVNDKAGVFFDILLAILDVFLMPTLFFIAGYFALPSLESKNTGSFIKSKFKRLCVPWLIGVSLTGPIFLYIYQYSHGQPRTGLRQIFIERIKALLSFDTYFVTSFEQFFHYHLWFISLLFLFFIVLAVLHWIKIKFFSNSSVSKNVSLHSNKKIIAVFFVTAVAAAILTSCLYAVFPDAVKFEQWLIVGSFLQIQPSRLVLYILCFSLGIYAFHKNWFIYGRVPGHVGWWSVLSLILLFCFLQALSFIIKGNFTYAQVTIFFFIRSFLVFSMILTFLSFGIKYWESDSAINQTLSENSYNIYLLHYVIVMFPQLLLYKIWTGSIYVKFIIAYFVSLILSYIISRFAINRYPKFSIAIMFGMFVLASIIHGSG